MQKLVNVLRRNLWASIAFCTFRFSEINLEHTSLINLSHNYLSTYGGKFSAEEFMAMHMNIMNRYVFSLILFIKPHRVHYLGQVRSVSLAEVNNSAGS